MSAADVCDVERGDNRMTTTTDLCPTSATSDA
jgi:hypothetical protein